MHHDITVRFQHVDAAGILYFSRAFELCHEALEELLEASGYALNDVLTKGEWVMPIVHASGDYRTPMRLGEKIRIGVSVESSGGSSLTFNYRMEDLNQKIRAEVKLVHVVLNATTFKSRPVPPDFLDALQGLGVLSTL